MKFRLPAFAAILFCCLSCVEVDNRVGSGYLPREQSYLTDTVNIYLDEVYLAMADSLSGFSQREMVVGSIMDEDGKVSGRDAVLTIAPLQSEMDFGKNPKLKKFHLALCCDSASVYRKSDENILQMLKRYFRLLPAPDKNIRYLAKVPYPYSFSPSPYQCILRHGKY